MAIRGTLAALTVAGLALVTLSACERGIEPELPPAVVPQPATAATAHGAMMAAAAALSDVAILAPRWAVMDFAGTTQSTGPAGAGAALWLSEAKAWRVRFESRYELDRVQRALRGGALVQYLAGGVPQPQDTGADAMRVSLDLSTVDTPSMAPGAHPQLRITGDLVLDRPQDGSPAGLHGAGACTGLLETLHDDVVARTDVDVAWTAAIDAAYGQCCPSGQVELEMAPFEATAYLHGEPLAGMTLRHAGSHLVRLVELPLACAAQHAARGTLMRSQVAIQAPAASGSQLQLLRSGLDGAPLLLQTGDEIAVTGSVDDRPIVAPPFIVGGDGLRLGELVTYVQETLVHHGAAAVELQLGADGRVEVDHSAITGLAHASTRVRLYGNLSSNSDGLGTHMEAVRPFLVVATPDDLLERLHAAFEGADLNLHSGSKIALTGAVNGVMITAQAFEVGADGETLAELLNFVDQGLATSGAATAQVSLRADGSIQIANGSSASLANIKLESGGSTSFNQVMLFGNIAAGGLGVSVGRLLAPATGTDLVDATHNGRGQLLNLDFDPLSEQTVIQIGGTLGGAGITRRSVLVTRGLTTLGQILDELNQAFNISNAQGIRLTEAGLIDVRGDIGTENRIDNLSIQEPSNDVSNLATSFEFRVLEQARDASSYPATTPVYDSLSGAHELTFTFTKRTSASVWDWRATLDNDEEVLSGETGTVVFDERGSLVSFLFTDGVGTLSFRPQRTGIQGAETVSLEIDPGTVGGVNGLTQFAPVGEIVAQVDGAPPQPRAHLYDLRLEAPGHVAFNALMRFGDVLNGTHGHARHGLLAPAVAGHRFADLYTEQALALEASGTFAVPLQYRATVGGSVHEGQLLTVERATTRLSDLLAALQAAVGAPDPGAVTVDAAGHIVLAGVPGAEHALSQLQVIDPDRPDGLLSLSLRFDVTGPGDSGCR